MCEFKKNNRRNTLLIQKANFVDVLYGCELFKLMIFYKYKICYALVVSGEFGMVVLRDFVAGEEESLFEVFYSSIHMICSQHYTAEQISAWAPIDLDRALWWRKISAIQPFVVLKENKIVGYSDVQKSGLIDHFFVHGEYQGQGIGNLLMFEALRRGASVGALHSEVSHTAQPFFQKYGFKPVKKQTVIIRGVALNN
ncbi:acetyltransferase, GNAT family [Teredinibacter turnerae T7901]|uniref:Acetyltransferase, GNAT family n=1 Tax=Teredinibacter turnerae (strain ATCC 39867 / T7901) TaxID=377629 RepID=C5BJH8_TERTT|nr:GNAT family N-acetyltransferase [Teredinibacter turnerae]ACR12697.1 acetyltransferase, GNAT family [Teredinibacter turnerae T7901]